MAPKLELRAFAKLYLAKAGDDNDASFGSGLIALLRGVEETGSLNRAAKGMHMAYSKAWKLMNSSEAQLGCTLIDRDGARGSTLTAEGRALLAAFDATATRLNEYANEVLREELGRAISN